jgi:tetratricopeptide (TPR) repeat protein
MIDNQSEVQELIEALNDHLPLRAYATPALVEAARGQGADLAVNDLVTIDTVLYLGDEGGVACGIELPGGKTVLLASITHLRIDGGHPLAARVHAYQLRRMRRIEDASDRAAGRSGPGLATKSKRKNSRAAPKKPAKRKDSQPWLLEQARGYWRSGEYARAADAFREVLALNRDDPGCCRYWLASCLFQLGSFQDLHELLAQWDDDSGTWRFAQALAAFRRGGDTEETQRLLVEADHREPGFVDYLLRDKVVDARREARFDADHAERAFACARLFLPAWRATPGAAAWARRILKVPPTSADPKVPRCFPREDLLSLPRRRETWQVGLARGDAPTRDDQADLCLLLVANVAGQEIRVMKVIDQPSDETVVWNRLIEAFLGPVDGVPGRPASLVVGRREFHEAWRPLLAELEVDCQYEEDPQPIGQLAEAMRHMIDGQDQPTPGDPSGDNVDIRDLPQSDALWQAGFVRSPAWVMNETEGAYRPWLLVAMDKSAPTVVKLSDAQGVPSPEMLLEVLVQGMARPDFGSPGRPRLVEVADSDCHDHLRPRLEAAGVACRLVDELSELDELCLSMAGSFDGPGKCSLADGQGVTPALMESFYEAAAFYFQNAPWRRVPGEVPIEVRCDDPRLGTRYAIVLGRTGVQLGLCVYDDWEITQAMLGEYAPPEENRALAVCYDEEQIMSAVDLHWIERRGWPIATPEAFPAVMRLDPRRMPRSASADELLFLDACLRAIPDFLKGKKATSRTVRVETGTRPVELRLAWKRGG